MGVQIRTMTPSYERVSLLHFCCQHKKGNKYKHQYHLETVFPPDNLEPCTVVKRMVKNEEGKMVAGGIVTCRENVFEVIDKWHRGNGHLGLERTWTYCKKHILECQPGTCQDLFEDVPHLHEEESSNQNF